MKRLTVLCFIILSFIAFSQNEIGKNVQKLDAKHTNYNLYTLFTNSKKIIYKNIINEHSENNLKGFCIIFCCSWL